MPDNILTKDTHGQSYRRRSTETVPASQGVLPVHIPHVKIDGATSAPGSPSQTDALTVQGSGYVSVVAITRPSDATPYSAGDIVGPTDARLAFTNAGPVDGHVILTGVDLRIDLAAVPSGMGNFRLYLFSALPTAVADNAVLRTYLADNAAVFRGYIDLGTPVAVGGILYVQSDQINKQFKIGSAASSLWGVLVSDGAYTPTSAATFTIKLRSAGL